MREIIGYVAGVDLPPVVDRIAEVMPASARGVFAHSSRDRIALRIPIPLEASRDGVSLLEERAIDLSAART